VFSLASRAIVTVCRGSGGLVLNYWLSSSGGGAGGERKEEQEEKQNKNKTAAYSTAALLLAWQYTILSSILIVKPCMHFHHMILCISCHDQRTSWSCNRREIKVSSSRSLHNLQLNVGIRIGLGMTVCHSGKWVSSFFPLFCSCLFLITCTCHVPDCLFLHRDNVQEHFCD